MTLATTAPAPRAGDSRWEAPIGPDYANRSVGARFEHPEDQHFMPIDPANLTEVQLQNLIENHRNKGATDSSLYLETLRELDKRKGKGLEFDKTFSIIRAAAEEGRYLNYKELADASGADWGQVHYAIGGHLWNLVEYAHRKGWPMLSAIVVNKPNVATGRMEPETLKGFIGAAHDLGYPVTDEQAFLKEQQALVFEWAQGQSSPSP